MIQNIQSLRALAVILVVLNHSLREIFPGGFVGVDIFFVISGYLMSKNLSAELTTGTYRPTVFMTKRLLRIYPAMFFTIGLTLIVFSYILAPEAYAELSSSAVYSVLSVSNFYFWKQLDYFQTLAHFTPLLHIWSLSLEVQFYILIAMTFLICSWSPKALNPLFFLGSFVSFVLCVYASHHYPVPNFYLLPTRLWEFGLGVLAHRFFIHRPAPVIPKHIGLLGMFLLFAAGLFELNDIFRMPSFFNLLVGLLTVLVIFSRNMFGEETRTLSLIKYVGGRSYSIYLVHQPILVSVSYLFQQWTIFTYLLVYLTILALAEFSYTSIEKKIKYRPGTFLRTGQTARVSVIAVLFLTGLKVSPNITPEKLAFLQPEKKEYICLGNELNLDFVDYSCFVGEHKTGKQGKGLLIMGDSHADSIGHVSLVEKLPFDYVVRINNFDCHPIRGVYDSRFVNVTRCARYFKNLMAYIEHEELSVLLVLRWTWRLYPVAGEIEKLEFVNSAGISEFKSPPRQNFIVENSERDVSGKAKSIAIAQFLDELATVSEHLYVLAPIPEAGWHPPIHNVSDHFFGASFEELNNLLSDYFVRNRFVLRALEQISNDKIRVLYPHEVLCSDNVNLCAVQTKDGSLYYDDDHLSALGVERLAGLSW
jgi:peptidoglycan/LPS O-acetylase OafA/YrhL